MNASRSTTPTATRPIRRRVVDFVAGGVCASLVTLATAAAISNDGPSPERTGEQTRPADPAGVDEGDTRTVTGQVVDLYEFLVGGAGAGAADGQGVGQGDGQGDGLGEPASGSRDESPYSGPIGLLVFDEDEEDEPDDDAPAPGGSAAAVAEDARIIVFDPANEDARSIYWELQQMIGRTVTMEGAHLERSGITATEVRDLKERDGVR